MVIFAETKGKKDDQHEDKEPPEVQGGVQGESRHGSITKKAVAMSKEERKSMVSKEGLCGAVGRQRDKHQHGQPWPCLGRHLHRAAVAQREAGVRVPEPLRNGRRTVARPGQILPLLQQREASPEPRIQDTGKLLSPSKRGCLTQKEQKHYRMRNNLYICNANPQTKTTLISPISGSNFGTHYRYE